MSRNHHLTAFLLCILLLLTGLSGCRKTASVTFKVIGELEPFLALFPADRVTRLVGPTFSLTEALPTGVAVPHLEL